MWKLQSGVARLTRVIKSLERGHFLPRFYLQKRQNADEVDSTADNLSVATDSQAKQRNQTEV